MPLVHSVEEAEAIATEHGYPLAIFPSFTLNGAGRAVADSHYELISKVDLALNLSPLNECAIVKIE
jgi:carbamoylphosphate synthase large subunit